MNEIQKLKENPKIFGENYTREIIAATLLSLEKRIEILESLLDQRQKEIYDIKDYVICEEETSNTSSS